MAGLKIKSKEDGSDPTWCNFANKLVSTLWNREPPVLHVKPHFYQQCWNIMSRAREAWGSETCSFKLDNTILSSLSLTSNLYMSRTMYSTKRIQNFEITCAYKGYYYILKSWKSSMVWNQKSISTRKNVICTRYRTLVSSRWFSRHRTFKRIPSQPHK